MKVRQLIDLLHAFPSEAIIIATSDLVTEASAKHQFIVTGVRRPSPDAVELVLKEKLEKVVALPKMGQPAAIRVRDKLVDCLAYCSTADASTVLMRRKNALATARLKLGSAISMCEAHLPSKVLREIDPVHRRGTSHEAVLAMTNDVRAKVRRLALEIGVKLPETPR